MTNPIFAFDDLKILSKEFINEIEDNMQLVSDTIECFLDYLINLNLDHQIDNDIGD